MKHKTEMVGKYLYYKMRKTYLPFYPDRLYLELTNNCNFQCIMCPNGKGLMKRNKGFMDFELSKRIIDEMAPHVQTIVLHIWGESLLHPRIFDIIKYCKKNKVKTELSTNTSLLNEEISNGILDSGLDVIYLCMDGIKKETYEKVRKKGDFEKAIKNIEDFLSIKKEKGTSKPQVNLQIIVMKETMDEIEAFKKRWSVESVDKINIKPLDTWGGQISDISSLEIEKINIPTRRFHCPNLWYHAHIYWDGTLVCCDRDFDAKNPLGNVKNGVMNEWNGPKMQELRRNHINQNLADAKSCSNCSEWCWWKPKLFSSWGNIPRDK
jgi:radical SAM protein with 4Fe4S-binding SPASM domain